MNDTFCVEAFVDYCDEMMIANEDFKEGMKKVGKSIIHFFEMIIEKINALVLKVQSRVFQNIIVPNSAIRENNKIIVSLYALNDQLNTQTEEVYEKVSEKFSEIEKEAKDFLNHFLAYKNMEKYNDKDQTINVAETGAAKKITDGIIKARSNAMKKKTEAIRLINSSDENREIKIKCLQLQAKISLRIAATSLDRKSTRLNSSHM